MTIVREHSKLVGVPWELSTEHYHITLDEGGGEGLTLYEGRFMDYEGPSLGWAFGSYTSGWHRDLVDARKIEGVTHGVGERLRVFVGGKNETGGRIASLTQLEIVGPTGTANALPEFVSRSGYVHVYGGDYRNDHVFYANCGAAFLHDGAINVRGVNAGEDNTFLSATSSAQIVAVRQLIANNAVRGSALDCFQLISGQAPNGGFPGHIGSKFGYVATNVAGCNPLAADGTVFGAKWFVDPSAAALVEDATPRPCKYVHDMRGWAPSGGFMVGPGFHLGVTGVWTGAGADLGWLNLTGPFVLANGAAIQVRDAAGIATAVLFKWTTNDVYIDNATPGAHHRIRTAANANGPRGGVIIEDLPAKDYANDTLAAAAGVHVGGLYHSSGAVRVRLV